MTPVTPVATSARCHTATVDMDIKTGIFHNLMLISTSECQVFSEVLLLPLLTSHLISPNTFKLKKIIAVKHRSMIEHTHLVTTLDSDHIIIVSCPVSIKERHYY